MERSYCKNLFDLNEENNKYRNRRYNNLFIKEEIFDISYRHLFAIHWTKEGIFWGDAQSAENKN